MDVVWKGHPSGFQPSERVAIGDIKEGEAFFIRIGGAVYRKVVIRHGIGPMVKQEEIVSGHIFDLTESPVYRVNVKIEIEAPAPKKAPK